MQVHRSERVSTHLIALLVGGMIGVLGGGLVLNPDVLGRILGASPPVIEAAELDGSIMKRVEAVASFSFERVLTEDDIAAATVKFTHLADEEDAVEDDLYQESCEGVVLGVQDSHYVIFTTRCAVDFAWPNHEVRWRARHGFEDRDPDFFNECVALTNVSRLGGDEWFCYATTNVNPLPKYGEQFVDTRGARPAWRRILEDARKVGDLVTIDTFEGEKGEDSDVALLYVPFREGSTIRLQTLGLNDPKGAVQELLAKQSVLFGFEFEFNCPQCQDVVKTYRSREKQAFILGFGLGGLSAGVVVPLIEKLVGVDRLLATGTPLTSALPLGPRIATGALRSAVLERDGFECYYARLGMCDPRTCWACDAKNLHIDHVLPFSRGGQTVAENLVTSCAACNLTKGAQLVGEWIGQAR